MLESCCGNCAKPVKSVSFKNISEVTISSINTSDIIYPILGRANTETLHGFWYIPFNDIPSAYYVTKMKTPVETIESIFNGLSDLWPLLLFCLLFALIAGYIVWVLETYGNKEEFPRGFIGGTLEGFWWSFISMTTVGYGDKTPRSFPARIFSVFWILVGITMF